MDSKHRRPRNLAPGVPRKAPPPYSGPAGAQGPAPARVSPRRRRPAPASQPHSSHPLNSAEENHSGPAPPAVRGASAKLSPRGLRHGSLSIGSGIDELIAEIASEESVSPRSSNPFNPPTSQNPLMFTESQMTSSSPSSSTEESVHKVNRSHQQAPLPPGP